MSIVRQLGRGLRNRLRRSRADEEIADEVESLFAETKADFETRGLRSTITGLSWAMDRAVSQHWVSSATHGPASFPSSWK
jgi:hypothetical protein